MIKNITILACFAALCITGCSSSEPTASTSAETATTPVKVVSYEKGTKKKGDKGVCVICTVKGGAVSAEEEVKLVLDYKDRTYVFCSEAEEAEFISDPKKYAGL